MAHAAAGVGARRVIDDLSGDRDGRARGGAARDALGIVRVAARRPAGRLTHHPPGQLRHRELAERDGSGGFHALHETGAGGGRPGRRAPGRAARRVQAGDVEAVLPPAHRAREGPHVLSAGGAAGQRASTLARAVGVELPDGAEVSELARQLEGTLDALDDSAGGHHGVE